MIHSADLAEGIDTTLFMSLRGSGNGVCDHRTMPLGKGCVLAPQGDWKAHLVLGHQVMGLK
jgi:hypothetical protein